MTYWLIKSEPTSYSIDDLMNEPRKTTCWHGVRNYQARNFMRDEMKIGNQIFFYHSSCKEIGVAGIVEVCSEPYPDFSAFDANDHHFDPKSNPDNPRWMMVDVRFVKKFSRVITLAELRESKTLSDMLILRKGNRLSITPVTKKEWDTVLRMSD
jgi:predicted RNA-binding protein with PUA-like domain